MTMMNTATAAPPLLATPQGGGPQTTYLDQLQPLPPIQTGDTFTRVPSRLCNKEFAHLSHGAKWFYVVLTDYAWFGPMCYPSQSTLAEQMGMTVHQIRRLTRELETAGLVSIEQPTSASDHNSLTYHLNLWVPPREETTSRGGTHRRTPAKMQAHPPAKMQAHPPAKMQAESYESKTDEIKNTQEQEAANAAVCVRDSDLEHLDQDRAIRTESTLIEKPVSISKAESRSGKRVRTTPLVAAAPPSPTVTPILVESVDPARTAIVEALIKATVAERTAVDLAALVIANDRDLAFVHRWIEHSSGKNNPGGYLNKVLTTDADLPSNGRSGQNQPFQPVRVQEQPQDKIIAGYIIPGNKVGLWDDPSRLQSKLRALTMDVPLNADEASQTEDERKMFHAILEELTGQRFDPRTGRELVETTEPTKPAESGVRVIRVIDNTLKQHLERIDHQAARYLRHLQIEHDTVKIQFFGNAVADFDCDFFLECLQGVYPNISRVELI